MPQRRAAFSSAVFEAQVKTIRLNAIGAWEVILETSYGDRHEVSQMADAAGELLNISVTRKA